MGCMDQMEEAWLRNGWLTVGQRLILSELLESQRAGKSLGKISPYTEECSKVSTCYIKTSHYRNSNMQIMIQLSTLCGH